MFSPTSPTTRRLPSRRTRARRGEATPWSPAGVTLAGFMALVFGTGSPSERLDACVAEGGSTAACEELLGVTIERNHGPVLDARLVEGAPPRLDKEHTGGKLSALARMGVRGEAVPGDDSAEEPVLIAADGEWDFQNKRDRVLAGEPVRFKDAELRMSVPNSSAHGWVLSWHGLEIPLSRVYGERLFAYMTEPEKLQPLTRGTSSRVRNLRSAITQAIHSHNIAHPRRAIPPFHFLRATDHFGRIEPLVSLADVRIEKDGRTLHVGDKKIALSRDHALLVARVLEHPGRIFRESGLEIMLGIDREHSSGLASELSRAVKTKDRRAATQIEEIRPGEIAVWLDDPRDRATHWPNSAIVGPMQINLDTDQAYIGLKRVALPRTGGAVLKALREAGRPLSLEEFSGFDRRLSVYSVPGAIQTINQTMRELFPDHFPMGRDGRLVISHPGPTFELNLQLLNRMSETRVTARQREAERRKVHSLPKGDEPKKTGAATRPRDRSKDTVRVREEVWLNALFTGDDNTGRFERILGQGEWDVWRDSQTGLVVRTPKIQIGTPAEENFLLTDTERKTIVAQTLIDERVLGAINKSATVFPVTRTRAVGDSGLWIAEEPATGVKQTGETFAAVARRMIQEARRAELTAGPINPSTDNFRFGTGSKELVVTSWSNPTQRSVRGTTLENAANFKHIRQTIIQRLVALSSRKLDLTRQYLNAIAASPPGQLRVTSFENGGDGEHQIVPIESLIPYTLSQIRRSDVTRVAIGVPDIPVRPDSRVPPSVKCFAAGTVVHTPAGAQVIERVRAGDLVFARGPPDSPLEARRVVRTFVTPQQPIIRITIVTTDLRREQLRVTYEHPFYVERRGWTPASALRPGTRIATAEGTVAVQALEAEAEPATVYNFEVEGLHNYFVGENKLWAHNDCTGQLLRGFEWSAALNAELTELADNPRYKLSRASHGVLRGITPGGAVKFVELAVRRDDQPVEDSAVRLDHLKERLEVALGHDRSITQFEVHPLTPTPGIELGEDGQVFGDVDVPLIEISERSDDDIFSVVLPDGTPAVVKVGPDPADDQPYVDVELKIAEDLEPYGGPATRGQLVLRDRQGERRLGAVIERGDGVSLRRALQYPPAFRIGDAHIAAVDAVFDRLAEDRRHLESFDPLDLLLTPTGIVLRDSPVGHGGQLAQTQSDVHDALEAAAKLQREQHASHTPSLGTGLPRHYMLVKSEKGAIEKIPLEDVARTLRRPGFRIQSGVQFVVNNGDAERLPVSIQNKFGPFARPTPSLSPVDPAEIARIGEVLGSELHPQETFAQTARDAAARFFSPVSDDRVIALMQETQGSLADDLPPLANITPESVAEALPGLKALLANPENVELYAQPFHDGEVSVGWVNNEVGWGTFAARDIPANRIILWSGQVTTLPVDESEYRFADGPTNRPLQGVETDDKPAPRDTVLYLTAEHAGDEVTFINSQGRDGLANTIPVVVNIDGVPMHASWVPVRIPRGQQILGTYGRPYDVEAMSLFPAGEAPELSKPTKLPAGGALDGGGDLGKRSEVKSPPGEPILTSWGAPITYSWELEGTKAANILRLYRPTEFDGDEETWLEMTTRDKHRWLTAHRGEKLWQGLVATRNAPPWMTPTLDSDGNRGWETRSNTFASSPEEFEEQLKFLQRELGNDGFHFHLAFRQPTTERDAALKRFGETAAFESDITALEGWSHVAQNTLDPDGNQMLRAIDRKVLDNEMLGPWSTDDISPTRIRSGKMKFRDVGLRMDLYSEPADVGFEFRGGPTIADGLGALSRVQWLLQDPTYLTGPSNLAWSNRPGTRTLKALRGAHPEITALFDEVVPRQPMKRTRLMFPLMDWSTHPAMAQASDAQLDRLEALRLRTITDYKAIAELNRSPSAKRAMMAQVLVNWARDANIHGIALAALR